MKQKSERISGMINYSEVKQDEIENDVLFSNRPTQQNNRPMTISYQKISKFNQNKENVNPNIIILPEKSNNERIFKLQKIKKIKGDQPLEFEFESIFSLQKQRNSKMNERLSTMSGSKNIIIHEEIKSVSDNQDIILKNDQDFNDSLNNKNDHIKKEKQIEELMRKSSSIFKDIEKNELRLVKERPLTPEMKKRVSKKNISDNNLSTIAINEAGNLSSNQIECKHTEPNINKKYIIQTDQKSIIKLNNNCKYKYLIL
jgi:hypothetical protein